MDLGNVRAIGSGHVPNTSMDSASKSHPDNSSPIFNFCRLSPATYVREKHTSLSTRQHEFALQDQSMHLKTFPDSIFLRLLPRLAAD